MEYLALYRKYRPTNFDDLFGQKEVVKVLKNAIESNKISHAYLFSGPRGTGKTTTAKILAKIVNCEHLNNGNPCEKCENCLNFNSNTDIVEMDAASNNGVDEIRDLKNKISLVPTNSKYKVYIIDEVHMLTIQAFNALLKTLEEPPSHAIFILATTELYKVPLTVASRCQKFQFSKITENDIYDNLKKISEKENIHVDDNILLEIARLSDGGMRDAINLLDQIASLDSDQLTIEDVYKINGTVSYKEMNDILNYIYNKDTPKMLQIIDKINDEGKNISKFVEELIVFLKDILIYKNSNRLTSIEEKNHIIIDLSKIYSDEVIYNIIMDLNNLQNNMKNSSYPNILLTVETLKISNTYFLKDDSAQNKDHNKKDSELSVPIKQIKEEKISESKGEDQDIKNLIDPNLKSIRINNSFATASKSLLLKEKKKWNMISEYLLDKKYNVVAGMLNDSEIVVAGEKNLILKTSFDSIADRINSQLEVVEKLISKIYDNKYKIIALSEIEWNNEKNKYIDNNKKKIKYEYIDEKVKSKKVESTPVDELLNLFGEDIVEYK